MTVGESESCGKFLKDARECKMKQAHEGKGEPLIGAAVHTSLTLLRPDASEPTFHCLREKVREVRRSGVPLLELEKYGDWDDKCHQIRDHIEGRSKHAASAGIEK